MKKVIVLVTHGKHDSVFTAKIKLFDSQAEAEDYVATNTSDSFEKYWVKYEIVEDGQEVDLYRP